MGNQVVSTAKDQSIRTSFIQHLLNDVKCLELMLEKGMIESGISRIGAEQEFCLISKNYRPQNNADEILKDINDPHFTNELALYNLEINLDPLILKGDCFDEMEKHLRTFLDKASTIAAKREAYVLLTGILPTISKTELSFEYMTPKPRYTALNDMMRGARGTDFNLHIKGVDELSLTHDSVLMEACNTSFQMHLQVDPDDFISSYNWAQAISGPVLGVCTNSPLLLGRELWNETRIALFQQSIDTRESTYALKDQISRVSFGEHWESGSIADIYKNEIAQHKILLSREIKTDSLSELKQGRIPKLEALNVHNGTIYRWNRPCYGATKDSAHVRIENRYIPAGPTIKDQMANFAFWVGLMKGRTVAHKEIHKHMDFEDVKSNFIKAARNGKASVMNWRGRQVSVRDLVTRELLPMAYEGLSYMKVDPSTAERLLSIIDARAVGQTGAQWSIRNYRKLKRTTRKDDALLALTKYMHKYQNEEKPIHEWPEIPDHPLTHEHASQVGHIMSTRVFTVQEDDLAELAIQLMQWKNIHHVPVENQKGEMCGLLTWTHMQRFVKDGGDKKNKNVGDIMVSKVISADPEMTISEAIPLMKKHEIGCLPVIHHDHLVGIVTIKDIQQYDTDTVA
ncbi:CBS domain-containing protein [Ekhidna sp.]|jgi:CBS domain-containing protein|uniref:CBS domain-containing protein n=1 Tax=Ekhidna sp. TaxID=2608089 RepID=UPI0032EBFA5E